MNYIWLIIIVLLALTTLYLWRRKKGIAKRVAKIKYRRTSPSGLKVWMEESAAIPDITAVESAMVGVFKKAAEKGYRNHLSLGYYTLVVLKADLIHNGQPVIKLSDKGYEGSDFDKGDYILATGVFLKPDKIVIADGNSVDQLKEVVTHEMVHAVLYGCDRERYERTRIHREGEIFEI